MWSRFSLGKRLKPLRAKRCRRPMQKAVMTEASAWASTVGVVAARQPGDLAQVLAQRGFDLVEEQVHALLQALVLVAPRHRPP